jgi:exosortase B
MAKSIAGLQGIKAIMPEWWPILIGMLFLYVPTFYSLFNGIWFTDEQVHQPIIFAIAIWLIYTKWPSLANARGDNPVFFIGGITFLLALVLYTIGRSQQLYLFEVGSFVLMLSAILLIKFGYGAIRIMLFPLFFMLFMIPLPGTLVIMLTMPMKMAVSYMTEHILYWVGYPIARNGVILQIGQYQLLIANACAGLQTLLSLEALGLLYLNLVRHASVFRGAALAIFIVPISFVANVIRVVSLTLITFYFGEAAGQGFLHMFSGIVLFLSALILIIAADNLLRLIVKSYTENKGQPAI